MADRLVANPVINGPYDPPAQRYRFDDEGITNQIATGRRPSEYFIPVPQARKKRAGHRALADTAQNERIERNPFVNEVRRAVDMWSIPGGYPRAAPTVTPQMTRLRRSVRRSHTGVLRP